MPRREGIVRGRSRCPQCGHEISALENIPVFGYLALRGRCRHCGARISPRYPIAEAATAVLFVLAFVHFGVTLRAAVFAAFFWVLVVLTVIDLEHKLLPNRVVYPSVIAGMIALTVVAFVDGDLDRLRAGGLGALIFGGFLFIVAFIAPAGMGGGDVKLAVLLGLFLGYAGGVGVVLVGMFLSFAIGALVSTGLMIAGKAGRKSAVPFGPFLAAGAICGILWGRSILDVYLGTL
ncbi:MAG: prepilin peptidase [Actinomycetota bacterium]|nr:prepilin peptidase [Actinomycetota bacterium]